MCTVTIAALLERGKGHILGNGLLNFHRHESSLKYRFRPRSFHLPSLPFSPLQVLSRLPLPLARLKSLHNAVSPPNSPSTERSMIKRKTSERLRRDRYLTFFEIPSVTTKLVRTRKKGKGDGPVGALISWGLRQLLPAERRKVLDLRWYLGYLLSRLARSFSFITARSSYRSNSEIRYSCAVHHVPVSMKINSLHYHVWDIIYAGNFPHRNAKGGVTRGRGNAVYRINVYYPHYESMLFITRKKMHSLFTC